MLHWPPIDQRIWSMGGDAHRDTHLATTNEFVRVHRQVVSSIDTFLSKFPIYS